MITTEQIIQAAVSKFAARRPETFVCGPGHRGHVHRPGESRLLLPNGAVVKITTDASGVATQVEEDGALHAIVRPQPMRVRLRSDS